MKGSAVRVRASALPDRPFLDVDMNQYPAFDINEFSTEDLEAIAVILRKYSLDLAELAEFEELRLGAGLVVASSRQR